jgi:hypothetical protein
VTTTAREQRAFPTPIEVLGVNGDTAQVIVVGWHITRPVTVPTDQLTTPTGLEPHELAGRWLEARANCHARRVEDLVIADVTLAPDLPDGWMACPVCDGTGGDHQIGCQHDTEAQQ